MTGADLLAISRSNTVKKFAAEFGFGNCRIAKATELTSEAKYLEKWLRDQRNGHMDYLENHFDKRIDPRVLLPGAKSVIVLSMNYYPQEQQISNAPRLSKYAYGKDYHKLIRRRLKRYLEVLQDEFGEVQGRGFVDSAPILEKAWATRSGLGWMGKHTNVITKSQGSFYFLAVLIVDIELGEDDPTTDHCGDCTACIDACPTNAIMEPYELDASKCISYFTIELKEKSIPSEYKGQFNDWMFGCDICQDVCPWNRFSKPHEEPWFEPKEGILNMQWEEWESLNEDQFNRLFEGSAVRRTKYKGLMRNITFLNPERD